MKHILYLCTTSTSNYNGYLPYFFTSLCNFILQNFKIYLILISDKRPNFSKVPKNIEAKLFYPIAHFPYPFNAYLKPLIIQNALQYFNVNNNSYMMFVDVDTIVRKCDNFNNFENCLLSNKMIFTISPWSTHNNYTRENNLCKDNYPEVYIYNIQRHNFLQSSFFAGNVGTYNQFCKEFFDFQLEFTKDWQNKRIPPMIDQSIITKMVYDSPEKYITDFFITNDYNDYDNIEIAKDIPIYQRYCDNTFDISDKPNIFLIQKFNSYIKKPIRYSI